MTETKDTPPEKCCQTFSDELADDNMFAAQNFAPFWPAEALSPAVYFLSDSGHGGWTKITYCPFCGQKFTWPRGATDAG